MKTLTTHTVAQLKETKTSALVEIYNEFAPEMGHKVIKKFRDRATAIDRVVAIQGDYLIKLGEQEEAKAEAPKKPRSKFNMEATISSVEDKGAEGTIENSLHAGIFSGHTKVLSLVNYIVAHHKRPRSDQAVDEQYAIHNIKWFVKKGHLKIED